MVLDDHLAQSSTPWTTLFNLCVTCRGRRGTAGQEIGRGEEKGGGGGEEERRSKLHSLRRMMRRRGSSLGLEFEKIGQPVLRKVSTQQR